MPAHPDAFGAAILIENRKEPSNSPANASGTEILYWSATVGGMGSETRRGGSSEGKPLPRTSGPDSDAGATEGLDPGAAGQRIAFQSAKADLLSEAEATLPATRTMESEGTEVESGQSKWAIGVGVGICGLIFGMIGGAWVAAWTITGAINDVRRELAAEIEGLSEEIRELGAEIRAVDSKSEDRTKALRKEISGRFDAMQAEISGRFDAMQAEISGRFDAMQADTSSRFDTVQADIRSIRESLESSNR